MVYVCIFYAASCYMALSDSSFILSRDYFWCYSTWSQEYCNARFLMSILSTAVSLCDFHLHPLWLFQIITHHRFPTGKWWWNYMWIYQKCLSTLGIGVWEVQIWALIFGSSGLGCLQCSGLKYPNDFVVIILSWITLNLIVALEDQMVYNWFNWISFLSTHGSFVFIFCFVFETGGQIGSKYTERSSALHLSIGTSLRTFSLLN